MRPILSKVLEFSRQMIGYKADGGAEPQRGIILNIILLSTILLSLVAAITLIADSRVSTGDVVSSWQMVIDGLLFFILLYLLSLSGKGRVVSKIFSGCFFVFATFMALFWGPSLPQALLFYALAIIISSIVSGSRFAFLVTILSVASLLSVFYVHSQGLFEADLSWRAHPVAVVDVIIYASVLAVIFTISWLYNREIIRALNRAKLSEAELKKERDLLESRIEERTADLKKENLERISQLSRFVEFGKLSSGIFHDMANHLSILLLMLDEKMVKESAEVKRARGYLDEFRRARADLEKFIASNKRRLREVSYAYFLPDEEIGDLLKLIRRSAEKESVMIEFHPGAGNERISGSPAKFSHIVTNLITNAVEAYDTPGLAAVPIKKVIVKTLVSGGVFAMEVRDFGRGITEEERAKIFDPFYTTKGEDKGTGLGLTIVKETVENDFGGEISFDSRPGSGAVFTVKMPIFNLYDRLS